MRTAKWLLLLVGIGILVVVIQKTGFTEIVQNLRSLGWGIAWPVLIFSGTYLFYTAGWKVLLKSAGKSVSFARLFRIKLIGESASALTPVNFAGGDPVRVWLLSKEVPGVTAGTTVVVDRTLHIFAIITIVAAGVGTGLINLELPRTTVMILQIAITLMVVLGFIFLVVQRRGLFEGLGRLSARLRIRSFSEHTVGKLKKVDEELKDFYRRAPWLFWTAYFLHLAARFVHVLEVFLAAHLLGVSMTLWQALFFSAIIPMTNFFGTFVPGSMGVLEGVVGALFYTLGWSPADGVALQVIRRVRGAFWYALGGVFFLLYKQRASAVGRIDREVDKN